MIKNRRTYSTVVMFALGISLFCAGCGNNNDDNGLLPFDKKTEKAINDSIAGRWFTYSDSSPLRQEMLFDKSFRITVTTTDLLTGETTEGMTNQSYRIFQTDPDLHEIINGHYPYTLVVKGEIFNKSFNITASAGNQAEDIRFAEVPTYWRADYPLKYNGNPVTMTDIAGSYYFKHYVLKSGLLLGNPIRSFVLDADGTGSVWTQHGDEPFTWTFNEDKIVISGGIHSMTVGYVFKHANTNSTGTFPCLLVKAKYDGKDCLFSLQKRNPDWD